MSSALLTLLLDLDDTLLTADMDSFLPAYYQALARHLSNLVPPDAMLAALKAGVDKMLMNMNPSLTLRDVFYAEFYRRLQADRGSLQEAITDFYARVFPTLGGGSRPSAGAAELVDWAISSGHRVAIATDPLFPVQATYERVRWAGFDPDRFELISTFETFHFSKSHPAYFAELLGRLGWPEQPALMVGNDVQRDLIPARKMGLTTFHINSSVPGDGQHGNLLDLRRQLESGELEMDMPSSSGKEAILAQLRAAPAALHGMLMDLPADLWKLEPTPDDWALNELVCHLRDTEREVHALQISVLIDAAVPFVPRPDAAVWAKQRRYLTEDGPTSTREFAAARLANLSRLETVADELWSKPARHAIFGPTSFLEVIGFMAEHDRMHIQQAWRTLQALRVAAHRK